MRFHNCAPVGRVTREQHFDLLNRNQEQVQNYDGSWRTNPWWVKKWPGQYWEIDEDIYWDFLEMLPPILFTDNYFGMCEYDHDVCTHCFCKVGSKYFCVLLEVPNKTTGHENMRQFRLHIAENYNV